MGECARSSVDRAIRVERACDHKRATRQAVAASWRGTSADAATARRAVLCAPLAILFAVVQWATVSAQLRRIGARS